MTLSNSTLQKLSQALTSEVINYIYSDDRLIEFLYNIVPDAVTSILGTTDENLKHKLTCHITSHIVSELELICLK